jgi:hypothetical protein
MLKVFLNDSRGYLGVRNDSQDGSRGACEWNLCVYSSSRDGMSSCGVGTSVSRLEILTTGWLWGRYECVCVLC